MLQLEWDRVAVHVRTAAQVLADEDGTGAASTSVTKLPAAENVARPMIT